MARQRWWLKCLTISDQSVTCSGSVSRSRRLTPVTRLWDDKERTPCVDDRSALITWYIYTNIFRHQQLGLATIPLSLCPTLRYIIKAQVRDRAKRNENRDTMSTRNLLAHSLTSLEFRFAFILSSIWHKVWIMPLNSRR